MIKTALILTPVIILVAVGFWFILPEKNPSILISDQKPEVSKTQNIDELHSKVDLLEDKIDVLENSNSELLSKISSLKSQDDRREEPVSSRKSQVLIPINPGGSFDAKDWKNLTSGSIKIDPADYPGYKEAYLIINLSVYVGQGKAFARLVNPDNSLAILESEVSTNAYAPSTLTSKPFKLPSGSNNYTIQIKTLVEGGYPAQAGESFLQITY
jgi:hypothetical protein